MRGGAQLGDGDGASAGGRDRDSLESFVSSSSRAYGGSQMRSVMLPNIGRISKNSSYVSSSSVYRNKMPEEVYRNKMPENILGGVLSDRELREGMPDVGLKSSSLNDVGIKASSFDMNKGNSFDTLAPKRFNA